MEDFDIFDNNNNNNNDNNNDDDNDEPLNPPRRRRRRRPKGRSRTSRIDYLNDADSTHLNLPSPFSNAHTPTHTASLRLPSSLTTPLLAGIFLFGVGFGVTLDSEINTNPKDLASRDAIDKQAPNPNLCATYGMSAMALDQRVFVSFNPFHVYVAQADVKPACVLRPENVSSVLQYQTSLLQTKEIQNCKNKMNTWAFVGELQDIPQLSCVYQSEDAQNEFLSTNPKLGIGEDVWDDDRERVSKLLLMNHSPNSQNSQNSNYLLGKDENPHTKKVIKDMLTEGQFKKQLQEQRKVDESLLK